MSASSGSRTPPSTRRSEPCAALLPFLTNNGYIIRVGFDTLIYMLLALGLNVVVGVAGLLDLGYVAFFGFGAYVYAMLASSQFHQHWPTPVILIVATGATVLLGLLVALPSRRLVGDYLAIVTLFFGQLFVTVTNNGEPDLDPRLHPRLQHHERPERDRQPRPVPHLREATRDAARATTGSP